MNLKNIILSTIKKHKLLYISFVITFTLSSIALSITPYVSSRLIGCFTDSSKETLLAHLTFWLIVFIVAKSLQAINQYFVRITRSMSLAVLNANVILDLFKTVHAHSVSYFDDEMTGRVSTAINKISGTLRSIISSMLFSLFRPLINFFFAFGIIAYTSPKLAVTLSIFCIPYYFIHKKFHENIMNLFRQRGKEEQHYIGYTTDSLTNYKLVRYTGSVFTERLNAYKLLKKYLRTTYKCETERGLSTFCLRVSQSIFTISCYVAILYFTAHDSLSLADAFFAFQTIHTLARSVEELNSFALDMASAYGELKSNLEIIYKPIDVKDGEDASALKVTDNTITIKNVCFSYTSDKTVFTNLNLAIPANQKVGLVGFSGAGKSTLVNLILRSYNPLSGEILIGTQNIADVTQYSLHKNIAYVPQDVTLFNRSLLENLQIANPEASNEDIYNAAKLANIHGTILNLPQGYNSIVGERGILLSGGERQRIAIARAILQKAPILILDEATSALDSESEIMVQEAIDNLMKNKTVIAIAHRLSTLRSMDRIIVLENGEIREDDSPQKLLKKKDGIFKHLYSLQTDGYLVADKEEN